MQGSLSQNVASGVHIPNGDRLVRWSRTLVHASANRDAMREWHSSYIHIGGSGLRTFGRPSTVAASVMSPTVWSGPQMVPNFRRDAVNSARELYNDPRCPAKASRAKAALKMIRLLDSQAWRAMRGAPFQFVRWIGALATVVVNWVQSGTLQSAAAYVPVLVVVALLLLPDAQSIEIAGVKFDRLTNEIARQRRSIGRLLAEVSLINNSLIAGSQVNITLGATAIDAALAATAAQSGDSPCQSGEPIGPNRAAEGIRADHEEGIGP